jgi:hypothetical protein
LKPKSKAAPSWATSTPRRHMSSSDESFSDTDSDDDDRDQFVEAVSRPSKKAPPQSRKPPAAKPARPARIGGGGAKKFIPETPMGDPEPTPKVKPYRPPRPARMARQAVPAVTASVTVAAPAKPARPLRPDRPDRQRATPEGLSTGTGKPARPARPDRPDRAADRPGRPARPDRPERGGNAKAKPARPARPDRTPANDFRPYEKKVSYAELSPKHTRPSDADGANLEKYLHADEFEGVFGMSQAQFEGLPAWKKKKLKQQKQLF